MDRAEFVINSMLVRKDFYSYTRIFSEYYAPADNKAKLYMRQFYNENGSIAYNEYIDGTALYMCLQMRCCITKRNLLHTFTTIEFNPRRYCHIRPRF